MQLAAGLPRPLKLDGATTKRIFKRAVDPWLPAGIADRPKQGFSIPIADWLRDGARDLPADVLLDPRATARGLFREDGVRALIAEHRDGTEDHAHRIWTLLQLELWFRAFVDTVPAGEPPALSVA
jgi:asparagine synthase (glutamine-hydrolysing)